jgi:CDP-glucose 4,6-dehydratase
MEGLVMNTLFWKGKKIFITGHTGFKGSWLCLLLQSLGADIVGYGLLPPTKPNLFELANVKLGMESIIGDIRDGNKLTKCLSKFSPDIVIHMAAQPLVRRSYFDPVETYSTNVMGTVNLLESVRRTSSVRAVVIVTTDKCYENKEWVWGYRETEAMGGYDPYSSSKGCAELVTAAYRKSFFNPTDFERHQVALATVRAGNVIGGGDWAEDRLIPDILRAFQNSQPAIIRFPDSTRPWQHVLEPLNGYLKLAENLYNDGASFGEAWNFGPNDEDTKTVRWIVDQLANHWGKDASWTHDHDVNLHEAHFLKLDCSKARYLLNWKPKWSLSQTLGHIINWHKAYLNKSDMREISLHQINKYSSS